MPYQSPRGMKAFTIVWLGQVLSLVGTAMSGFALTIWAWEITGSATALALVGFFSFAPQVLFSPISGALVDRWNRKLVMALSDLASGLTTILVLILFSLGKLEIWHLYILGAISGTFQSFQWPAYSASISLMIPKEQLQRASGMMGLAEMGSGILAPTLAAACIAWVGISGVLTIDIITFVIALIALAVVRIPQPKTSVDGALSKGSIWQESIYGFRYILERPSLLGLQLVFMFGNLLSSLAFILAQPMVLARTDNNAIVLGSVQSIGAIGGVVGSLLITATGGPKRRILGVLGGWFISGLAVSFLGLGSVSLIWMGAMLICNLSIPFVNSSNQAIWQSKVAPDVQGRVFSVRRMIAQISAPLSMLIAGPLADKIAEPLMQNPGSLLSRLFGDIFGRGPGSGMALIITISSVLVMFVAIIGAGIRNIRDVEDLIPDQISAQPEPAD